MPRPLNPLEPNDEPKSPSVTAQESEQLRRALDSQSNETFTITVSNGSLTIGSADEPIVDEEDGDDADYPPVKGTPDYDTWLG